MTCLSSKQNVYGLPFDDNSKRLEEDKLQCICSGKYDNILCPLDQESSDAECDNLRNACAWKIVGEHVNYLSMNGYIMPHTQ